jgi:non-specific serine/threonine protein kinase
MHAAELAGLERGATSLGDAGEKLDQRAREQYRRRLEDLREQAEEAERFNDPTRAAKARAEIDAIATELSAAFGLGGRSRRASSDAERARLMVTQRIKAALRNITEASPALGRHLGKSIRTGLFCSYEPQEPISWNVS